MNKIFNRNHGVIAFGIPLTLMGLMVLLAKSSFFQLYPRELSIGITFDLILTVPLLYFLLIQKKEIPKITTVPFFIAGIIIASFIVPKDYQFYLSQIKYWVLPIVEISIFFIALYKIRQIIKLFRKEQVRTLDFYSALKNATKEVLPQKISTPFATEISVIYYGFISWKRRAISGHEFTYHKKSGTITLLSVFIFMILIETAVVHLLLQEWSSTAAWVLSILSFYTVLQVFGMMRSMSKRPISIENNKLKLRYGLFSESTILLSNIEQIEISRKPFKKEEGTRKLSPLQDFESHNIILRLKEEAVINGLYGLKNTYKTIAFHVDEKERFKKELEHRLTSRNDDQP